jgi:CHAT domain-containing protein
MARGDALKLLGRTADAWEALGQAGSLFQSVSDEVGWARTRIGRVLICVDLNRVEETLADVEQARAIFIRHRVYIKRVVLDLNTGILYNYLGDHQRALALYRAALTTAESLGEAGQGHVGLLTNCIGYAHTLLGDLREALMYYERARAIFAERAETSGLATAELNIAYVAQVQGQYRRALDLLHHAQDLKLAANLPLDAAHVSRDMIECYLQLNRYREARDLAIQVIETYRGLGVTYREALTLLHLATAEAELHNFESAQAALDTAEPIFTSLGATTWIATTRLRRGQIALRQGDTAKTLREAGAAAACFEASGEQSNYATATLLYGRALFAIGQFDQAAHAGATTLRIARRCNIPSLRYAAHLLLGRVAEVPGDDQGAARRYAAAIATIERVQRGLSITLRPGFLEDKGEALRSLIALRLRNGRAEQAFTTLERAKSLVLLGYLTDRAQLRWAQHDPHSRALMSELDRLRDEHHWFYRLAHERPADDDERHPGAPDAQQALAELASRERRMRALTEQLYLRGGDSATGGQASAPTIRDVQRAVDEDTLLIEFYVDGAHVWAFTLDSHAIHAHRLPIPIRELDRLLAQLQANLAFALSADPHTPIARSLVSLGRRILQQLHAALLAPLARHIGGRRRLIVVPYGALHYLPFHLLHNGAEYLIEQCEVIVLPAAGLATRRGPTRIGGALALAHSWDGQLPQTHAEARIVQRLLGGQAYYDNAATRITLQRPPVQVLHIASHGEHRLDQPDLSYIHLADGQLYTDDLLQHDMSYELVTLSACETGRANVTAGDELIGLGRGFLYAGAGALISSLWRVTDNTTVDLMRHLYQALQAGAPKATALRDAQRAVLADSPDLHPAFWGAFQLIGDPSPLSTPIRSASRKEPAHAEFRPV